MAGKAVCPVVSRAVESASLFVAVAVISAARRFSVLASRFAGQ